MGAEMSKSLVVCQAAVRNILTLFLLYGVYLETGIWTTISIGLIFLSFESAWWLSTIKEEYKC